MKKAAALKLLIDEFRTYLEGLNGKERSENISISANNYGLEATPSVLKAIAKAFPDCQISSSGFMGYIEARRRKGGA